MSKAIVAENKHEKALVAMGRSEARQAVKREKQKEKVDKLKSDRNALRRDVAALEAEVDAGKPSHKITTAVAGTLGTAGGAALQIFAMGKVENKYVRNITVPAAGTVMGSIGLFVDGILGAAMTGLGFGLATGSGTVIGVRTALGA